MIASIKLENEYKLEVSDGGKLDIDGTILNIKDIPIVRFSFERYTDDSIKYIESISNRFSCSTPLIEIKLSNIQGNIDEINRLSVFNDSAAMYLYVDVFDYNIENDMVGLDDAMVDSIAEALDMLNIDMISLVDKTTELNAISASKLMAFIADELGWELDKISICSSPLSCTGAACLTAVKARAIMAEYSKVDDVPLPTANHEKSCCGCIQFINILHDIKSNSIISNNKDVKNSSRSQKKKTISIGMYNF